MSKVEEGQTVEVHYVGTFDDGTEFDNSHTRGETITFQVGSEQMISGFNSAVLGMSAGESKTISIAPEDGYGDVSTDAVMKFPTSTFPENLDLSVGATVVGTNQAGQKVMATVVNISDGHASLDFNHPLAGKNLNFNLELISIS
jgi:FKBP-type peptidyl-prolyl cis-trans isomerase 2